MSALAVQDAPRLAGAVQGVTLATNAPSLAALAGMAVLSLNSPASRRNYARECARFLAAGCPLTREGVQGWLVRLRQEKAGAVTRNVALAAIRLLAREANERGLVDDITLASITRIKGVPVRGQKVGRWLDLQQVKDLLSRANSGPQAVRNGALVALMVGCGLRRAEVCALEWPDFVERGGRVVLEVRGKGERQRTIPVPDWVMRYVEEWRMDSCGN